MNMDFRQFDYASLEDLRGDCIRMGLGLTFSENTGALSRPVSLGARTLPNCMAMHPMEGSDGEADGSPGELTARRYDRFSRGGAGLIWFEAVAVAPEARASKLQLWLHEGNLDAYRRLFENMMKAAAESRGQEPTVIMQITHSGRFSKPDGMPAPLPGCHDPYLDERFKVPKDLPVLTDGALEALEDRYAETARLAQRAGFHGVDLKACHRYLISELLSARTREGRYGGSFEGRTRFLLNVAEKVRSAVGKDFIVASRLNIYDGIPQPYGWGVDREDYKKPDYTEPKRLIAELIKRGVSLVNLTMGTPYYNPHVNRPYDKGSYVPDEHPLTGVTRLASGVAEIQREFPGLAVVGTGYSWLRRFAANFAAANVDAGNVTVAGFGREAFAYPDFAADILDSGEMKPEKCCIACGKCAELLRAGGPSGCVVRDGKVYAPIYRELCGK